MISNYLRYSFHSIFRIFTFIIILISGIIIFSSIKNMPRHQLIPFQFSADSALRIAHDFDKDGHSETLHAYYNKLLHQASIVVVKHNGGVINEWSIPGTIALEKIPSRQWIAFGDINYDNYDEVIVFAQEADSLFLYAIDVKNSVNNLGKFLIKRSFLIASKKSSLNLPWYIADCRMSILDLNNDNQNELVFTLFSGYTRRLPRGIYLYDFKKKKIIYKYETHASLMKMDFFDLNNDGKKEIILNTYASGNFPPDSTESDFFTWVFVFDYTLTPLFKPIRLYGFTSEFLGIGLKDEKQAYIIGLLTDTGKSNEYSKLFKIDNKGNILNSLNILNSKKNNFFPFRIEEDSALIIAKDLNYNLSLFNQNFSLIKRKEFNENLTFLYFHDLNLDGKKEFIAYTPLSLYVFDQNLQVLAHLNFPTPTQKLFLSIKENGLHTNKSILISSSDFNLTVNFYTTNFYKNKKFLLIISSWGLLVLILLFIDLKGAQILIRWKALPVIQQNSRQGIIVLNDKGKVVSYNTTALMKLDINDMIVKKMHFKKLFASVPSLLEAIEKSILSSKTLETKINVKDLSHKVKIIPLEIINKIIIGYLIEIQEKENCSNKRLEIWANTIKKLAHDIKTPLSNIEIGVRTVKDSIAQSPLPTKEILIEDLDILSYEVRRITNVVRNFLKFVNLEKPHFQLSDLHQCIQKSIDNFEAYWKSNFTIELDFDPQIPSFYFDPQQLEMVFNNLIKNALDALRDHGNIIIRTSMIKDEISENSIELCEIEVIDNGPGIEKEKQQYIFDPEFSDKESGSGLGLTIVKKIIEDHNGEIKVFSTPGLGTTFRILLPLKRDDAETIFN